MMNDDQIILTILKEIRSDQKLMLERLNQVTNEVSTIRNGYTPHEVVELLHYVDDLKKKEENRTENIRRAVINWITPIILSATLFGLFALYR